MATATMNETYMTTMTVAEWAAIPDNPRQRDTERRAANAKHLFQLEAAHTLVHMAEWDDGCCKLEGHTRAKVWTDRPEIAPETIEVRVYLVKDKDEAKRLYSRFNSVEEGEKSSDRCFGAMRDAGITPTSALVREAKFSNAVRIAVAFLRNGGAKGGLYTSSVYEAVEEFKEEIRALDAAGMSKRRLIGPAICCYLLARRKHGERVDDFFSRYTSDAGVKQGKYKDCVQHFSEAMAESNSRGGYEPFIEGCAVGLACIDRWVKSDTARLARAPKADPFHYLD